MLRQGTETVQQEIASMKEIEHPNCVRMFDVLLAPAVDQIFLVLEYVDGGTSQQRDAKGQPIPLRERTVWSHLRHLVLGLEYLHMHGIVHRDIKPESERTDESSCGPQQLTPRADPTAAQEETKCPTLPVAAQEERNAPRSRLQISSSRGREPSSRARPPC
eukprot:4442719-Prymnesium_polylepis.1